MWPNYTQNREFQLPGINNSFALFDVLNDGRIISSDGKKISIETALQSGKFVDLVSGLGGYTPFIRVNRNNVIACASDDIIRIFDLNDPTNFKVVDLFGYDAEWLNDDLLVVTVPERAVVIDTRDLSTTDLITGIGGASAGITFDSAGNAYTGNGLDTLTDLANPSVTGTVKYFDAASVQNALATGNPIDFEQNGTAVIELLSGGYLGFDYNGDLHICGGDPTGSDMGFAALIRGTAIQDALANGTIVDESAPPESVFTYDPDSAPDNFYFMNNNPVTRELYFSDFSKQKVFVFR